MKFSSTIHSIVVGARLASFDERQRAVAKDHYHALEARYRD
ncbi:MAG TPA: hypothetical protein VFJ59_05080 [Pseudolabrys sp.]|jgi:hypothetical protein|nr:hypothetical protein [Pseudolabrys sp.]